MKVGVLAPQSKAYPMVAKEFIASLKLGYGNVKDLELIVEDIGVGASEKVVMDKVQKFNLQEEVDVVVGLLSHLFMEPVTEQFDGQEQNLLVCNLGGHMPYKSTHSPFVFYNSLQLWKSLWALGTYAAETYGKKLATSSGFYEAGYHLYNGFEQGYIAAGGSVELIQITQGFNEPDSANLKNFGDQLKNVNPDFILGLYNTTSANTFLQTYKDFGWHEKYPLLTHGIMVEDVLLPKIQVPNPDIIFNAASWCMQEEEAGKSFIKAYQETTGRQPGPFALLGYETGLQLAQVADEMGGKKVSPTEFSTLLRTTSIDGPRGEIGFTEAGQQTKAAHYLRKLVQAPDGQYYNQVVETLPEPTGIEAYLEETEAHSHSGWSNSYLCV